MCVWVCVCVCVVNVWYKCVHVCKHMYIFGWGHVFVFTLFDPCNPLQNDDKEARKAELIEEHDQAKAAREKNGDEPDEEEEEEFLIQLKDIENEVYEEEADPQILEEEIAARERVETVIKEKVEEQKGTTASLKVSASVL